MNERTRKKMESLKRFEQNSLQLYESMQYWSLANSRLAEHRADYRRLLEVERIAAHGAPDWWVAAQLRVKGYDTQKNTDGLKWWQRLMLWVTAR
jgi:hypothetical protein